MSFMPGFRGAKPILAVLSFYDVTYSTTGAAAAVPTGTKAGDLLVWYERSSPNMTGLTPSGFTELTSTSDVVNAQSINLAFKIADGTETSIASGNPSGLHRMTLVVFRGNTLIKLVSPGAVVGSGPTDGNPSSGVIPASGGTAPLVAIACYSSNAAISPRTFSPSADGELSTDTRFYLKYKIYNSSPADITVDMDDEGGSNVWKGVYLACQ